MLNSSFIWLEVCVLCFDYSSSLHQQMVVKKLPKRRQSFFVNYKILNYLTSANIYALQMAEFGDLSMILVVDCVRLQDSELCCGLLSLEISVTSTNNAAAKWPYQPPLPSPLSSLEGNLCIHLTVFSPRTLFNSNYCSLLSPLFCDLIFLFSEQKTYLAFQFD